MFSQDGAAPARPRARRSRAGALGVGAVFAAAGLMFTTSALASDGSSLRSERGDLAGLIQAEGDRLDARLERVRALEQEIKASTAAVAADDAALTALQRRLQGLEGAVGLAAVHGPGITVTLDDAPADVPVRPDASPDDLVVHQQDVQAVVNALWAGGAEAMKLQDQRVISTSAVRCVGNTLILQGRVYAPPYTVTAVGDVARMQATLDASPEVSYYREFVRRYSLGWQVQQAQDLTVPAFDGSVALQYAGAPRSAAGDPAPGTRPSERRTP